MECGGRNSAQRKAPCTVLIVDDDELIRRGIAAIISDEPDFCVCGFAGDESTAVKLLELHQPDLLLLDLSLGHRDGVLFLKDIAGRFADTQIITVSDEQHRGYRPRTLELGAAGYLAKRTSAVQLIATMRAVVAGGKGTRGRRSSVQGSLRNAGKATRGVASLTDRELHVFRLIGEGLGTSRIAQELGLSRKTIETYREHIKLKLVYANAEALLKGALDWTHHSPVGSLDVRKNRGNPR